MRGNGTIWACAIVGIVAAPQHASTEISAKSLILTPPKSSSSDEPYKKCASTSNCVIHLPASMSRTFHSGTSDNREAYVTREKKWHVKLLQFYSLCSRCFFVLLLKQQIHSSFFLLTVTLPPEPPPMTMKSYSKSISRANFAFGRLHGSSKSHCDRIKTSSRPMNSMNWPPPQSDAKVWPAEAAATGQSHVTILDFSR